MATLQHIERNAPVSTRRIERETDSITSIINETTRNFGIKRNNTVKDKGDIKIMFLTINFSLGPSDNTCNMLINPCIIQIFKSDGAKIRKVLGTSKVNPNIYK